LFCNSTPACVKANENLQLFMSELSTFFAGPFEYEINIYVVAQNTLNDI
jgi:hypothetical protein